MDKGGPSLGKGAQGLVTEGRWGGKEVAIKAVSLPPGSVDGRLVLLQACDREVEFANLVNGFLDKSSGQGDLHICAPLTHGGFGGGAVSLCHMTARSCRP